METGCVASIDELFGTVRRARFPISDVVEVRWVPGSGKQSGQAESVLAMRSGRDLRLASQSKDEAEARQARLKQFFAGAGEPHIREHWTTGLIARLTLIGLALFAAVAAFAGLWQSLPFRVEVLGDSVRVPRRRRTFDVSDATRVRVDIDPDAKKLGYVVVETRHGEERLLDAGRAGVRAHQRAAEALGKVLSLESDVGQKSEPRLKMPRLPRKIPWSVKVMLGGTLLLVGVGVAVEVVQAQRQGTLELECRGRCRFDNLECLPGGSLSTSLPPGDYLVETWAPDEPNHWKKHSVPIQIGVTQHFICPAEATR